MNETWPAIRDRWVEAFRNKEVHAGESIMHKVTGADEWCAEAYMETDYSKITQESFERTVRDYAIFRVIGAQQSMVEDESSEVSQ